MTTAASKARTEFICSSYRRALSSGEHPSDVVSYLATIYSVQRHAIWKRLRTGGVLPPYKSRGTAAPRKPRRTVTAIYKQLDDAPRVSRDPCPRCGCRGDIACGHSRAPLGMML